MFAVFFIVVDILDESFSMLDLVDSTVMSVYWQCAFLLCIMLPVCTAMLIYYWSRAHFAQHPIVQRLKLYDADNWLNAAAAINTEYRRVDKFSVILGGMYC